MAQIGVDFRARCICLTCGGCNAWDKTTGKYSRKPFCRRDCVNRPECMPMGGCPGYNKEVPEGGSNEQLHK